MLGFCRQNSLFGGCGCQGGHQRRCGGCGGGGGGEVLSEDAASNGHGSARGPDWRLVDKGTDADSEGHGQAGHQTGQGSLQQYVAGKLQALVYDILPSNAAVFGYAIGSRHMSANEQFFCWCSSSSKFVANNSNYIRRLFYN